MVISTIGDPGRQRRAADRLARAIDAGESAGVQYAIADASGEVFRFRAGFADLSSRFAVTDDTTFHIFSATKLFTGVSVMQLVDDGKLRLSDPLAAYAPFSPYGAKVTLEQLLCHTAGVPNPLPLAWIHTPEADRGFDFEEFLRRVVAQHPRLTFEPGSRWAYSNVGYMLLGHVISQVSGVPYRARVRERVLAPLGIGPAEMDFRTDAMPSPATGYLARFGMMTLVARFAIDMKTFGDRPIGKWLPLKPFYLDGSPYGGLIGTAGACLAFLCDLLADRSRLLSAESRRALFEPQRTTDGTPTGMTRGWFCGELVDGTPYLAHPGGGGGYYAELRVYPTRKIASTVLFNRTGIKESYLDDVDRHFMQA